MSKECVPCLPTLPGTESGLFGVFTRHVKLDILRPRQRAAHEGRQYTPVVVTEQ
jgi:hypothetical protein